MQGRGRRRAHRLLAARRARRSPRENPDRQVVFFAVGFETTAPANAMAVLPGARRRASRTSPLLCRTCWCRRPCEAILVVARQPRAGLPGRRPRLHGDGLRGVRAHRARSYHVPIVVTGFEPLDILQGVYMCVQQLEEGRAEVENQYARSVRREGNRRRSALMREVFRGRAAQVARHRRDPAERPRPAPRPTPRFDAERRFGVARRDRADEPAECISGRDPAGPQEAARVPGLRHALHAGAPAGRDHGLVRGRLRRLLPLPARRRSEAWREPTLTRACLPGPARAATRACCWPTAAAAG